MNKVVTDKVTRLEVIDYTVPVEEGGGRTLMFWDDGKRIELSLQDDGKTLKIFIKERKK